MKKKLGPVERWAKQNSQYIIHGAEGRNRRGYAFQSQTLGTIPVYNPPFKGAILYVRKRDNRTYYFPKRPNLKNIPSVKWGEVTHLWIIESIKRGWWLEVQQQGSKRDVTDIVLKHCAFFLIYRMNKRESITALVDALLRAEELRLADS